MSVRSQVKAWLPVIIAGGVLAAGGLVAIPLGGWDTVRLQSATVPEQPIGQPYVGNRLATAIDDIYLTDEHPDGYSEPEPGKTFLVVVATMENVTAEPQFPVGWTSFYSFTIPGVIEVGTPLVNADYWVRLQRDNSIGATLIPGVPDTVLIIFAIPDDLFAEGDEVAVGIPDARPEAADIYDGTRWVRVRVAAEVHVVMRDER